MPHALPIAQRRSGTIQQQPDPPSLLPKQPRPAYRPSNARLSEIPYTRRHQPDLSGRTRVTIYTDAYLIRSYAESWQAYQPVADGQAFQAVPSQRPSERPYSEAGIFSDDLQNTFSRPALKAFNQHHLGILRNDTDLSRAIAQLRLWKQNQAEPHTVSEYENRNLLECSLTVAQAAYRRRQSIGAHFNSDC